MPLCVRRCPSRPELDIQGAVGSGRGKRARRATRRKIAPSSPASSCPVSLLLPQLAVTLVFFYWPAAQALWQSFLVQDAFGLSTEFVWFDNYVELFKRPDYYHAVGVTFAVRRHRRLPVARPRAAARRDGGSNDHGREGLPHLADLALCGGARGRGRAVASSCSSRARALRGACCKLGHRLESYLLNGDQALALVILAAAWKQISYNFLFFLAGLQADPEIAHRGGRDRRREAAAPLLDHRVPAAVADDLLPARRQHHLRVLRHLRHHPHGDPRRPRQGDRDARLQGLPRRQARRRSRRLGGAIGDPDGHRDRAHRDPVPLSSSGGCITRRDAWSSTAVRKSPAAPRADRRRSRRRLPGLLGDRRLDP